jgi:hypothetical protein
MIGSFFKIIRKINIPLPEKDPSIYILTALNDSMMLLSKELYVRSNVSRFSNLDKLSKPIIDLLKKKTMQFAVFRRKIAFYRLSKYGYSNVIVSKKP